MARNLKDFPLLFNRALNLVKNEVTKDVAVTANEEFDRNFERQAFFTEDWEPSQRVKQYGGSTLIIAGHMRRSLRHSARNWKIRFTSDLEYFGIHNAGGIVRPAVTPAMRKYAWYRHKQTGETDSKWKGIALTKKPVLEIKIPRRQVVGHHPMLDKEINITIEKTLKTILK